MGNAIPIAFGTKTYRIWERSFGNAVGGFFGVSCDYDPKTAPDEHSLVAFTLGVKQILVVVTKMDVVNYDQNVFACVKEKTTRFLTETGYNGSRITFVPVSALFAENIEKSSMKMQWFTGPCLLDAIRGRLHVNQDYYGSMRCCIKSVSEISEGESTLPVISEGESTLPVLSGRIAAGCLADSENVVFGPGPKLRNKVVDLVFDDRGSELAVSGASKGYSLKVTLKRNPEFLKKGHVMFSASEAPESAIGLEAQVVAVSKFKSGFKGPLVVHEAEVPVKVSNVTLVERLDGAKLTKDADGIEVGDSAMIQLIADEPFMVEKACDYPLLGRMCLVSIPEAVTKEEKGVDVLLHRKGEEVICAVTKEENGVDVLLHRKGEEVICAVTKEEKGVDVLLHRKGEEVICAVTMEEKGVDVLLHPKGEEVICYGIVKNVLNAKVKPKSKTSKKSGKKH